MWYLVPFVTSPPPYKSLGTSQWRACCSEVARHTQPSFRAVIFSQNAPFCAWIASHLDARCPQKTRFVSKLKLWPWFFRQFATEIAWVVYNVKSTWVWLHLFLGENVFYTWPLLAKKSLRVSSLWIKTIKLRELIHRHRWRCCISWNRSNCALILVFRVTIIRSSCSKDFATTVPFFLAVILPLHETKTGKVHDIIFISLFA